MNKLIYRTLLLAVIGIGLTSCNKEEDSNIVMEDSISLNEQMKNTIGSRLATTISDVNTKNLLLDELEKEWGGDYQILFKDLPNNLANLLQKDLNLNEKDWIKNNPKLRLLATENSISILKNESNFIVAVESETEDIKNVVAFNSIGEKIILSSEFEPNLPLIILGFCEVCDKNGEINVTIINEPSQANSAVRGARSHGKAEKITYIKTPNLSSIEKWYKGKPELRIITKVYNVSYSAIGTGCDFITTPKRSDAKNGYNTSLHLFHWWFASGHGANYFIQTIEEDDKGSTTSSTFSVKTDPIGGSAGTLSSTITHKQEDTMLYGQSIESVDPAPFTYNSSSYLHFKLDNL